MKSSAMLARVLSALIANGGVAASAVPAGVRETINSLIAAGALHEERRGAGIRIAVTDETVLQSVVDRWFPAGLAPALRDDRNSTSRARSVAVFRDAKVTRRAAIEAVFVRGFGESVLRVGEDSLPLAHWTRTVGVSAINPDLEPPPGLIGQIAIVENMEPFMQVEAVIPSLDAAVYAGGRMSERLLAWLAAPEMSACTYVHFGDYDPVGIDEYLRLKQRCPGRVVLYLPESLADLFARYANQELVRKNSAVLRRIRGGGDDQAGFVIGLIDRFGGGVEQEVVFEI